MKGIKGKCDECGKVFLSYEVPCLQCRGMGCKNCDGLGFIVEYSLCRECYGKIMKKFHRMIKKIQDEEEK